MRLTVLTHDGRAWSAPFPTVADPTRTLVLAFGASGLIDRPAGVDELLRSVAGARVIGCSTAGEIVGRTIRDGSLVVAIAEFERTTLDTATARVDGPGESFTAGETIARALLRSDLRGVLVLSDGLNVNGSELVRGLNAVLPESVVVTGGLAADGSRFQKTWVLEGTRLGTGIVTAVGFSGDAVQIGHGSRGGWDIFGPERRVTRSRGNVLFELDGRPALELYRRYLGDRADGLPATGLLFPLALRATTDDERHLVRTILAVDDAQQSLTFAGDIPTGWLAQLMSANFDRLVEGASIAAETATAMTGTSQRGDSLAIAISCVGRRLVLGERAEEEVEATAESLGGGTAQVGFYSYGEVSPFAAGPCDLHNQTMTLTTVAER